MSLLMDKSEPAPIRVMIVSCLNDASMPMHVKLWLETNKPNQQTKVLIAAELVRTSRAILVEEGITKLIIVHPVSQEFITTVSSDRWMTCRPDMANLILEGLDNLQFRTKYWFIMDGQFAVANLRDKTGPSGPFPEPWPLGKVLEYVMGVPYVEPEPITTHHVNLQPALFD